MSIAACGYGKEYVEDCGEWARFEPKSSVDLECALYEALLRADEVLRTVPCVRVEDAVHALRLIRPAIALYESKRKL